MKFFSFQQPKSAILAGLLALAAYTPMAQASVVIGNYSLSGAWGGTWVTPTSGTTIKAAGFRIGSGSDYLLDNVMLRLNLQSVDSDPTVSIYADSGADTPGTLLTTLADPVLGHFNTDIDAVFTAASPFTLHADTAYWVVLQTTGGPVSWLANAAPTSAAGAARNLGYWYGNDGTPAIYRSGIFNIYQVSATDQHDVPEPATLALVAGALLAALGVSRRRAPM